jgi:hypothetical protein
VTEATHPRPTEYADTGEPAAQTERSVGWALALIALVLGVIGLLAGFGLVGNDENETLAGTATSDDNTISQATDIPPPFWDGILWLLPAISAATLAYAVFRSGTHDHERHWATTRERVDIAEVSSEDEGQFRMAHSLAYLMGGLAIGTAIVGMLVGWDVFDAGNDQYDGIIWMLSSITCSGLAATFHSVRHRAAVTEEEYIVRVIDERMGAPRTTAPATEAQRLPRE